MSIQTLKPLSKAILNHIKAHPGCTSVQLTDALTATHTQAEVTSFLWSLWNGRYITRKRGTALGGNGAPLFQYFHHTDKPRRKPWKRRGDDAAAHEMHVEVPAKSTEKTGSKDVQVAVVVSGGMNGEKLVLTLEQAKDLRKMLNVLEG